MQDIVGSLFANLEGVVRWFYPGILIISLRHLGLTDGLISRVGLSEYSNSIQILALVFGTFVSSFIAYTLHRYILQEVIEYLIFYWILRWGAVVMQASLKGPTNRVRRTRRIWQRLILLQSWNPFAFLFWNSRFQRSKFAKAPKASEFLPYLTYSWAVTHAIGMSSWIVPLMYSQAEEGTNLSNFGLWRILAITALLFVAWAWQEINNTISDIGVARETSRGPRYD